MVRSMSKTLSSILKIILKLIYFLFGTFLKNVIFFKVSQNNKVHCKVGNICETRFFNFTTHTHVGTKWHWCGWDLFQMHLFHFGYSRLIFNWFLIDFFLFFVLIILARNGHTRRDKFPHFLQGYWGFFC